MTYDNPKISFAYPTFLKAGMLTTGPFYPDIGCQVNALPSDLQFYVSAGLILNGKRSYSYDVDVLIDGNSLIPNNIPAIDSKLLNTAVSERDDFVALSTMLLSPVTVSSEGLYTIRVMLYSGIAESEDRKLIDQYDCHFVLAKNWLSNEMKKMD